MYKILFKFVIYTFINNLYIDMLNRVINTGFRKALP